MAAKLKGARVRAAAAGVVDAVATSGRSLDAALAAAEETVPLADRSLLRMLCFGTLRNYWQLQAWANTLLDRPLKKRDNIVKGLLVLGLFQLSDTRIPDHAAVSATVEAARLLRRPKHAGVLNAVLRRFNRERIFEQAPADDEARFNHPSWLIHAIKNDWHDDWQQILDANNERAPMWLRTNARRMSAVQYLESLQTAGMTANTVAGFDQAICLDEASAVSDLPGFDAGDVSVQDAAAQIAAAWLPASGRRRVLDACAAPGGKAAHILELSRESELTCLDSDSERLMAVRENLARLDLHATVTAGDASKPSDWWDGKPFDDILLDAPCSASGVIRRHPDIKLLRRQSDIAVLARLQGSLLGALWPLLAPAGRLLYVTCSVLAAENDAVVDAFLRSTADAKENDMLPNNNIRAVMRPKARGYQILPGTAGMDGFYYACLEKVS